MYLKSMSAKQSFAYLCTFMMREGKVAPKKKIPKVPGHLFTEITIQ